MYSFGKSAISLVPDVIVLVAFFSPLFHDIDTCLNLWYIDYPTQVRAELLSKDWISFANSLCIYAIVCSGVLWSVYAVHKIYDTLWYPIGLVKSSRLLDQYCSSNNSKHKEQTEHDEDVDVSIFHLYIVIYQHVLAIHCSGTLARLIQQIELGQQHQINGVLNCA